MEQVELYVRYRRMTEYQGTIKVSKEKADKMLELDGDYRYYGIREEDRLASEAVDGATDFLDFEPRIEDLEISIPD